ncbi:AAA family ATPase [Oribacterium sp. WCC10]|uniref:AAA family ATPase n=1 Tax=Oribacterium sp. WCC10 TaxID=1855343 RepID=UPI0008E148DC|nr:AAA family ATPase [Oribacterium sp. WCC10]SFG30892.1 PD-(D/E)XK nuclease superfamily protein [Oribacterium sp. WCC10]
MLKTVGLGLQDYEKVITENAFYVDKTYFINEWWQSKDDITLITRPRRFGKTLMLSTVEKFFSERQGNNEELFDGLSISQDTEMMKECGKWPVLFVSFASVKAETYKGALQQFNWLFTEWIAQNTWLTDKMGDKDLEFYQKVSYDMDERTACQCLNTFCRWLSDFYNKKVIILIDEYDTPMQEAYVNGYWDEISGYMRNMFNSTLKTNPNLQKALLTGITRVSRESLFSDLNNLKIVTISSDKYADCFGFTEKEVFEALEAYGYSSEKKKVKEWYDGFKFGNTEDIYNPWSIISFLQEGKYEPYWANTSSNSLVSKLVREGSVEIKKAFEDLLNDGVIQTKIDEQLVYGEITGNKNAIWSLLFSAGYLKPVSIEGEGNMAVYSLKLTNHEVKDSFSLLVERWFENAGENYSYFVKALLEGNIDDMTDTLSEICESMISTFDGSGKAAPENFYHGLVIGLLVELRGRYEIKSNRESGLGRYDVMLRPKDKKDNAVIIEFKSKRRSDNGRTLDELCDIALKQIEDKKYETELLEAGYSKDRIIKLAFAFEGKELLIKKSNVE